MEPVEFLKQLCGLARKSSKFDQGDIEQALAWLDAYETYKNPTIENLHLLWQIIEDARKRRREGRDKVRKLRTQLSIRHAENKRQRDMLIVDYRKQGLTIVEAEVKADQAVAVIEIRMRELELKDELDDAEAALDVLEDAVKDAKGEYYQLKHDKEILTETGGYHG